MNVWTKLALSKLTIIFLFLGTYSLSGQMETAEAFDLIQNDGLVIRLNCNKAKIDTLGNIINRGGLKEATKAKLIKEREKTMQEFNEKNKRVIARFEELYSYSKVYFVPDSLFKEFVEGRRENIFVNNKNVLFSETSFPDHFVFAYFDYSMKMNALRFRHSEYKPQIADYKQIKGKFPADIKGSGGVMGFLKTLVTFGNNWEEYLDKTIKNLQSKFEELD